MALQAGLHYFSLIVTAVSKLRFFLVFNLPNLNIISSVIIPHIMWNMCDINALASKTRDRSIFDVLRICITIKKSNSNHSKAVKGDLMIRHILHSNMLTLVIPQITLEVQITICNNIEIIDTEVVALFQCQV